MATCPQCGQDLPCPRKPKETEEALSILKRAMEIVNKVQRGEVQQRRVVHLGHGHYQVR